MGDQRRDPKRVRKQDCQTEFVWKENAEFMKKTYKGPYKHVQKMSNISLEEIHFRKAMFHEEA